MIVSITGSTGNMGLAVLKELCTLPEITSIKLLDTHEGVELC